MSAKIFPLVLFFVLISFLFIPNSTIAQVQIGSTITANYQSFGSEIAISGDGSKVATSYNSVTIDSSFLRIYQLEAGDWQGMGNVIVNDSQFVGINPLLSITGERTIISNFKEPLSATDEHFYASVYHWSDTSWKKFGENIDLGNYLVRSDVIISPRRK